eukprot:m.349139 g.349139  ORF g.349139 m.349139 type:complete len:510 (-) comp27946_c1_seq2:227-1756(-)
MMPISAKTHGNQGARVLEEENAEMATRLRELKDSLRQRKEARGGGVIWRSGDRKSGLRSHANEVLDGRRGRNVRPANNRPTVKKGATATITAPPAALASPPGGAGSTSSSRPRPPPGRPQPKERRPPHPPTSNIEILHGPPDEIPDCNDGHGVGATSTAITYDDTFNEAESHASFLDALNEWRRGGDSDASATAASVPTPAGAGAAAAPSSLGMVGGSTAAWAPSAADPVGGALLDGDYDEQAAADSFKTAVAAWRGGSAQGARPSTASMCSAQTDSLEDRPIQIKFTQNKKLSFVEQMMLRKKNKKRGGSAGTASPVGRARGADAAATPESAAGSAWSARGATPESEDGRDDDGDGDSENEAYISITDVGAETAETAEGSAAMYAVEEPCEASSDEDEFDGDHAHGGPQADWSTPGGITPEWSQGEADADDVHDGQAISHAGQVIASSTPDVAQRSTRVVDGEAIAAVSRDMLRVALDETPDPHGRHVITPSLMHDFEEMERSFNESP